MAESPSTAQQPAVTVFMCLFCRMNFTDYNELRCHVSSTHPHVNPLPAAATPSSIIGEVESSTASAATVEGMGYSESRSQVAEPRRSSRLLAKSAMTMSQSTDMVPSTKRRKPDNPKPKCLPFQAYQRGEFFVRGGYLEIRYHGITWIGVHGVDSICAVYNKKPGRQCIIDWLKDSRLSAYFTDYVLSEMEDVADSPPYLEKILKKPATVDSSPYPEKTLKPFAVVSLPDTSNADGKSCQEASVPSLEAQGQAIAHLQNKMIDLSAYSMRQAQLIALSAFQLLCERELKAEEITVCCFYEEDGGYEVRNLSRAKVNKRLEAIN